MQNFQQLLADTSAAIYLAQQRIDQLGAMIGVATTASAGNSAARTGDTPRARNSTHVAQRTTATRKNRTRAEPRDAGNIKQLVEAAARQHKGAFTPAELIQSYPALKGSRPNIVGRYLKSIAGLTKTGGSWSFGEAQREAA